MLRERLVEVRNDGRLLKIRIVHGIGRYSSQLAEKRFAVAAGIARRVERQAEVV